MATMAANIHESGHPLIMHKITQMRKAAARPKYLHTLIKEVSTFLCYEATKDLPLEACDVQTLCGAERGLRIAQRVGVVPVLRGGLGMVEAMTEFCSNAQVWHLGIYRDKKSLLPVEYYNKLPKRITVQTVFVLDPMPMSGATAVAAMDILKAWGSSVPGAQLRIKFVCLGASEKALAYISESHPDVDVHVGLIDRVQVNGCPRAPPPARRPPARRLCPAFPRADAPAPAAAMFKTLVGKEIAVELKNDVALTGTLHSIDQYLNIKLLNTKVVDAARHPQLVAVTSVFVRGSVVRYIQIPAADVDTELLQDACRKAAAAKAA